MQDKDRSLNMWSGHDLAAGGGQRTRANDWAVERRSETSSAGAWLSGQHLQYSCSVILTGVVSVFLFLRRGSRPAPRTLIHPGLSFLSSPYPDDFMLGQTPRKLET